ncbi:MAG: squalene--hopene cyclase, partial [Cohnella sp.]|nr:squalene--hopene cyclase [Cohnella sp.]
MTKVMLAATGQIPWPRFLKVPLAFLLLPSTFPVNLFDFSVYARAHMIPAMVVADRKFSIRTSRSPVLAELIGDPSRYRLSFFDDDELGSDARPFESVFVQIVNGIKEITELPDRQHAEAIKKAERYMLERIEPDGTLYSYATSTFLMIFALLAIGYGKRHPVIRNAVRGLKGLICRASGRVVLQNSPSEVWDTALLSYALQEAGVPAHSPSIRGAASYLLSRQHRKRGDWAVHNPGGMAGGWGFSDSNTLNPDVDDTTAALRAIKSLSSADSSYLEAWNRGLSWLMSMQNDDGGWPAFEKNTDRKMFASIPLVEAKSSAIDPSTPDLTGRTLSFFGKFAGLDVHHAFVRKGAEWLTANQEKDGSWYGRWGVCYIYGTWAALTGLRDVGIASDHPAISRGTKWLTDIQNDDGGWGESCGSDVAMRYVPLRASTSSQTAWALDALIAVYDAPTVGVDKGIDRLIQLSQNDGRFSSYPTGAGLPGIFYSDYHSY